LDFSTIKKEEEEDDDDEKDDDDNDDDEEEEEEEEETLSATLQKEHMLTASENRVLRKIFRPKKDEVTGEWRDCIRSVELLDLYFSP
jgi:hypothetical protein